jgi:BirA family biotin operon repressor/biotin-[acetyl-CoA-carboxylase] ligase
MHVTGCYGHFVIFSAKFYDELVDIFSSKCVNLGKKVKIIKNGQEKVALAVGVSSDGGLEVEINGNMETVISGEVSVRGIYGYCE